MRLEAYEASFEQFGKTPRGMGYNGVDEIRQYQAIHKAAGPSGTIVDLGCGYGIGKRVFPDLVGVDIHRKPLSGGMVNGTHECIRKADWVLMCGIFSIGYSWDEVMDVVESMWAVSAVGIACTFLLTESAYFDGRATGFPWLNWQILFGKLDIDFVVEVGWDAYLAAAVCRKKMQVINMKGLRN